MPSRAATRAFLWRLFAEHPATKIGADGVKYIRITNPWRLGLVNLRPALYIEKGTARRIDYTELKEGRDDA